MILFHFLSADAANRFHLSNKYQLQMSSTKKQKLNYQSKCADDLRSVIRQASPASITTLAAIF